MKIAIISDIHSNMEAFTAFINIAKETGIEEIYSCGDIVGYGPNPEECVKLYTEHRIIGVKGNHDAAVVDESVLFGFNTYARSAIVFTKRILSKAGENFLKDLPFLIETEKFTIFHGFPSIRAPFRYILTEDDAMEAFMNVKTPISFYGHTHKPCICVLTQDNKFEVIYPEEKTKYEIKEGFKYLINVGSIGQPRDGNPKSIFAVYDDKLHEFEFMRYSYNIEEVYKKIIESNLPAYLGERLFLGF